MEKPWKLTCPKCGAIVDPNRNKGGNWLRTSACESSQIYVKYMGCPECQTKWSPEINGYYALLDLYANLEKKCYEYENLINLLAKYLYRFGEDEGYWPDISKVSNKEALGTIQELIELEQEREKWKS